MFSVCATSACSVRGASWLQHSTAFRVVVAGFKLFSLLNNNKKKNPKSLHILMASVTMPQLGATAHINATTVGESLSTAPASCHSHNSV